jgi:hypothetical protein
LIYEFTDIYQDITPREDTGEEPSLTLTKLCG